MGDPLRLYGLKALVTSGASGIGEAVSRTLAKHGGQVLAAERKHAMADLARSTARVARRHAPQTINYERPEGTPALRATIAQLLVDDGCMVREDDVIVTNGAQEAMVLALRATAQANDIVAVESPTFFGVLQAIELLGLRALELPTDPRKGVDLDSLASAVRDGRPGTAMVGWSTQLDEAQIGAVVDYVRAHLMAGGHGGAATEGRQPVQPHGEDQDQDDADQEGGQGDAHQGRREQHPGDPPVAMQPRVHAERHPDEQRQHRRHEHQLQGGGQAIADGALPGT